MRNHFRPGDIGKIVSMHGTIYAAEHGWDHTFEAYVAAPLGAFAARRKPRERIWLVDDDAGELAASIGIVEANPREAQLRWLLVAPALRGRGVGHRLIEEAVNFSRAAGYASIFLLTVNALTAAARLYDAFGFEVTHEEPHELWGAHVVEQRYDLPL